MICGGLSKRPTYNTVCGCAVVLLLLVLPNVQLSLGPLSIQQIRQAVGNEPIPFSSSPSIQDLTRMLEGSTTRYYIYNDEKVVLPKIRARAIQNAPLTWKHNWGKRFADYAMGEIRWLEALESHPLRTLNISEAAFFITSIPVGAALFWGSKEDLGNAFRAVLNSSVFQRYPERHVAAIATTEKVFGSHWWGLAHEEMQQFKPATIVRDSDMPGLLDWYHQHGNPCKNSGIDPKEKELFSHAVSLGFGGEGSRPNNPYHPIDMKSWNNKTFWFFYHSRIQASLCNSTQFRHAFFTNETKPAYFDHQPVSIGPDIPPEQWIQEFSDSKFCLVIRGDTPGSRALNRAIRAGCMPLIVSDALPIYQPIYHKTLEYDNFALLVGDDEFLKDPIGSLDKAVASLSLTKLRSKIEGLRLMQRIVTADQPDSLFVPAFAREIVETMKDTPQHDSPVYYDADNK